MFSPLFKFGLVLLFNVAAFPCSNKFPNNLLAYACGVFGLLVYPAAVAVDAIELIAHVSTVLFAFSFLYSCSNIKMVKLMNK